MLSSEFGTHLTGRNLSFKIFPFSFKEFLKFKKFRLEKNDFYLIDRYTKIKKLFLNYVKFGGFPQYLKEKDTFYLSSIFENIIYKDIITRYRIAKEKTIKELCLYLISNVAKEISFSKLKNLFNLASSTTIKEYVNYLENSFLFFTINKFDYSLKKQILNPKKIYSIDTAFSANLSFKFSENFGRQLENVVFLELKRNGYEIYYHRQKKECDFLIKEKEQITKAIQVSKTLENEDTKKREIDGLLEAMKLYNLKSGLILTEDEEKNLEIDGLKIFIKPIWKWFLE